MGGPITLLGGIIVLANIFEAVFFPFTLFSSAVLFAVVSLTVAVIIVAREGRSDDQTTTT